MKRHSKAPSAVSATRREASRASQTLFGTVCLCVLGLVAFLGSGAPSAGAVGACSNEALRVEQHSTALPDCRAYEQVSPAEKGGNDVMPFSPRTRASSDGNAVGFASLGGFGDVHGTGGGIAFEYLAQRGAGGWTTHSISPAGPNGSLDARAAAGDTFYDGDFSADFGRGVLASLGRIPGVAGDENVKDVANLYLRDDLRSAGPGAYQLLTACPGCEEHAIRHDMQLLTLTATAGTYKLSFEGQTTGAAGTGDLTEGSKTVENVSASSGTFVVGEALSGSGVPAGSTIAAVEEGGAKLVLTNPGEVGATATATAVALTADIPAAPPSSLLPSPASFVTPPAAVVQAALEALPTIGAGNVSVWGGPADASGSTPFVIAFGTSLGSGTLPLLTADGSGLSGGGATISAPSALPPLPAQSAVLQRQLPKFVGASADMSHVVFSSTLSLTDDTPPQNEFCGLRQFLLPPPAGAYCVPHLYEWHDGHVALEGVLPDGQPADASFAGIANAGNALTYTPHAVSDGRDGHIRVTFVQPTGANGSTPSEQTEWSGAYELANSQSGNLFMREDDQTTVQLNESERTDCAGDPTCGGDGIPDPMPEPFAPAKALDASSDGSRIFFSTSQALTDDAQPGGEKLYVYDATKPPSAPDNLTVVGAKSGGYSALIGVSTDGHYAYFFEGNALMMWHDGTERYIGEGPFGLGGVNDLEGQYGNVFNQARVTADGRHLIFLDDHSPLPGGYDHGICGSGFGCAEVYVYSAESDQLSCASCNPSGAAATADATVVADFLHGGSVGTSYSNRGISDDGSRVFFSTAEALVPQDTNGKMDAYEYNVEAGTVSLISSGTGSDDSFYLDSSPSGDDVFFATRDPLVGWDTDTAYDLYDARVGGGFPEPPPQPGACEGESCRGSAAPVAGAVAPGSASLSGAGNVKPPRRCPKGSHAKKSKGKTRCAKNHAKHKRHAKHDRRAGR